MVRTYYRTIAALLLLLAASCKKDEPAPPVAPPPGTTGDRVFIVAEGSLGNGNSSLGLYLPGKDSVYEDVYKAVNQQALGDVFQSMTRIGNELFLCVNNSDKIIVLNATTYQRSGVINVPKPRYIVPVSPQKAFVSSLFNNKVYAVNPQTRQVTADIPLPVMNAEGLHLEGAQLWTCPWDTAGKKVYLIDTATLQITDSIALAGYAPQEIVRDKDGLLWVLSGNVPKGKSAALTVINPATKAVVKSFNFPPAADPIRPVLNVAKDTLYFIEVDYSGGTQHNGIYRMPVSASALPAQPFLAAQALQYFWALGIDPRNGNIYVGDPRGFTQKGRVMVYRPDGALLRQFTTGIGPGHFYFD